MAEIKVRITGDNADFKKKLEESSAESRLMAAEMREQFNLVKEKVGEVAGENGLGKISHVLGDIIGGPGGAIAFGAALLGGVVDAVKEAAKFEGIMARLGTQFGSAFMGKEMGEFIESIQTIGPNKEQLAGAAMMLGRGGMTMEEVKLNLPRLQKLAIGTGEDIGTLAEEFAKGEVGIPRGLQRNVDIRAAAQQYGERPAIDLLRLMTDPGGKYFNAIQDQLDTPGGKLGQLGVNFGKTTERVGAAILEGDFNRLFSGGPGLDRPQDSAPPFGPGSTSASWGLFDFKETVRQHKSNLDREKEIQDAWKIILDAR